MIASSAHRTSLSLLIVLLASSAGLARAEGLSRDEKRRLYSEAIADAAAGRHGDAVEKYRKLDAEVFSPVIKLAIAKEQAALNQDVEAYRSLRQIVDGPKAAGGESEEETDARAQAAALVGKLAERLAFIHVDVAGPGVAATVSIDGKPAPVGEDVPVTVGVHAIHVEAPGFRAFDESPKLRAREMHPLTVKLVPVSASPAVTAAAPPPSQPPPTMAAPPPDTSSTLRTAGWITAGVGGGVGLIAGIAAWAKTSSVKSDNDGCATTPGCSPDDLRSRLSSAKAIGWVSTVGFGVGLAGVAVALFAPSPTHEQAAGVRELHLSLGARDVGVGGKF